MSSREALGDVLLVGSLPFETAEESLSNGATLGSDAAALPDGEVGTRMQWTGYLPLESYSKHPDLIETHAPTAEMPDPDSGFHPGTEPALLWTFRVKPGVESFDFNGIGYAEPAIESYAIFKRLREEGKIAAGVRFQVSLPATGSAILQYFDDPEQWPVVEAAYARAIEAEIKAMLEVIPADDLSIQFDAAVEVCDLSIGDDLYFTFWPERTYDEKFAYYSGLLTELTRVVPDDVVLGIHWCYGTWGGWPMEELKDMQLCVDLSNDFVQRAARQIDYVHMPAVVEADTEFFKPLKDLDIGDTKVYLGLVHHTDGIDGARTRIAAAREWLPQFGVAAVCGYGREDPAELNDVLELNLACARALAG
ncbi:MAG TPA: hypothetical protein VNT22_00760 [Baekduia sp.]|nr:hypothetical protein [Baekduia sp.]